MMPDLSRAVAFRSKALNSVSESIVDGKTVLVGCTVDFFDPSAVELQQFREPLALKIGMDVGGVWTRARTLQMRGVVYDKTRGEAFDRLKGLIDVMIPDPGTFGYYALTYYTVAGSSSSATQLSVMVMPQGLRYAAERHQHGTQEGQDGPLAIPWSVTFYAKTHTISTA